MSIKNPYNFALYNWHLEISSKCSLKCPRCPRTEDPELFSPKELSLEFIKKVFNTKLLSQVHRITFSGVYGDPIYNAEMIDIVKYLKSKQPSIQLVVITNGGYKNQHWWRKLAEQLTDNDEIIFSIDGWDQESNQKYRINSDWNSMMLGLKEMVKSKAYVRWSSILFSYNYKHIDKMRKLAQDSGADAFYLVLSDRFGSHKAKYLVGSEKACLGKRKTKKRLFS